MALNSAMVFEIRTTGNANNGGGFKTGASGTDYSQQDASQKNNTDLAIDGVDNTKVTSAGSPFDANDVGNVIRISAGTGFTTGWYEVTAVASAVATLDRACGTAGSTGGTWRLGGAILTFQDAFFETLEPGNKVWVKSGTYNMTESLNVAKDGSTAGFITIEGYKTTRGDKPTAIADMPDIQATASNFTWIFDDFWVMKHFGYETGGNSGLRADQHSQFHFLRIENTADSSSAECMDMGVATNFLIYGCELLSANANTNGIDFASGSVSGGLIYGCYIHDCGIGAIIDSQSINVMFSIFDNCATGISFGVTSATRSRVMFNTFYGAETPSGTGIAIGASDTTTTVIGNIFYGLTTGINQATAEIINNFYDYNDFFNNTTNRTNVTAGLNDLALDPQFTNAASGDFSIGTNLKAAGFPGVFPGALTTGYLDIGAAQRQEVSAGGWFSGE